MLHCIYLLVFFGFFKLIRSAPFPSNSEQPYPEILQRASCSNVTVFFARGTTEPGTLGLIAGPPFNFALKSALRTKSLSFVGINYPANVAGFLAGGDRGGSQRMADSVRETASACPNTKIIMSGYSQGAQLVHKAAALLSPSDQQRVNAVVVFGDPDKANALPATLEARRKTFCAIGDLICAGRAVILAPHLSYGSNAGAAASFVVSQI